MATVEKRARQNIRARSKNRTVKTSVRDVIKKVRAALKAGNKDEAKKILGEAVSIIDRAASRGVLHRNNASRKISRLTSQVQR